MNKKYILWIVIGSLGFIQLSAQQKYPYQNPALSSEKRADDLIGRMTLEEKVFQLQSQMKFMHEYKNRKFIEYLNIISAIVKEGQQTGHFRNDIMPGLFKRSFFGALDELSNMFVFSTKRKYNVEMAADQVSSFFIAGLIPNSRQ